ncbi:MAG: M56 family metallopeptidase [Verrucomicrobiia bacterium]
MMELSLRITYAAAQVLWIGALIAFLVFALDRIFTRSAAGRHAMHLLGLILTALVLPVAFFTAPLKVEWATPLALKAPGAKGIDSPAANAERVTPSQPVSPVNRGNFVAEERTELGKPLLLAKEAPGARWESIAPWVAGAYLVGLFGMAMRMACGFASSARMRRHGDLVQAGTWTEALQRMGDSIGVRARPVLKWSQDVAAPVIIGMVKPAILLPVALASRLSPAQVETVLAHELAHLRRRDSWALAVQRWVETVLFFHPAVWWMSHQMELAREEACDDLVLAAGCDPADYAEALVICSECRLERRGASLKAAAHLAVTGSGGAPLRRRILRLIGSGDDGTVRLGKTGWMLALLLVGGVALVMAAGNARRPDLADFDFDDPPSAYERGIKVADRHQRFEVEGLQFQASALQWEREGWLRLPDSEQGPGWELFLNLGARGGYEIVEVRLFDHATRKLIHSSKWRNPDVARPKFVVERVESSSWLRMKETGEPFPDRMDIWLRLAIQASGQTFRLAAKTGASASHDGSEVVITTLLAGSANGRSGATGEMQWDLATVHGQDRELVLNMENRGKPLRGQYHLVAVTKDGSRYPMDHTHFWDFQRMRRHAYFRMDVALADVSHFELIPFKSRSKFFFNGLEVPGQRLPAVQELGSSIDMEAAVADRVVRVIQSYRLPFITGERLRGIRKEVAALVRKHQRDDLDTERKRAILASSPSVRTLAL